MKWNIYFLSPLIHQVVLKRMKWGFPGGPVVKNLPASTGERFDPWSGKIPHATEQLSQLTPTPFSKRKPKCSDEDPPPQGGKKKKEWSNRCRLKWSNIFLFSFTTSIPLWRSGDYELWWWIITVKNLYHISTSLKFLATRKKKTAKANTCDKYQICEKTVSSRVQHFFLSCVEMTNCAV